MATAIPLTLNLLILIGLYELAVGLAGLTRRIDWVPILDEFDRSPAMSFMAGFAAFAVGAAIHLSHHHWTDLPAIIVTGLAWIALVEGLLIMIMPALLLEFSRRIASYQRTVSVAATLFGATLILLGVTGRVDPTAVI